MSEINNTNDQAPVASENNIIFIQEKCRPGCRYCKNLLSAAECQKLKHIPDCDCGICAYCNGQEDKFGNPAKNTAQPDPQGDKCWEYCSHSDGEHDAFDRGKSVGESGSTHLPDDEQYAHPWRVGNSVGILIWEQNHAPAAPVEEQELLPPSKIRFPVAYEALGIYDSSTGVRIQICELFLDELSHGAEMTSSEIDALGQFIADAINAYVARAQGDVMEVEFTSGRQRLSNEIASLTATVLRHQERIEELERGWMPCTDKMPEAGAWYACTVDDNDGFPTLVEPLWLEPSNRWTDGEGNESQATVIAWMPLPAPFAAQPKESDQ
jgi:hypothetical protein